MQTGSLEQAMAPGKSANLQAFSGIVLTAALLGRNFLHSHQPSSDDHEDNVDGGFWTRHRAIETILLNTASTLPDHLRLPSGLPDPNIIFLNMSLHTVAICLHQAAIFRAEKQSLPVNVSNDSKILCVTAAVEIASIMRMIGHMELIAVCSQVSSLRTHRLSCIDECIFIFLRLRRSTGIRSVPEDST